MKEKNYANLVRQIFGTRLLSEDRDLNRNPALADAVEQIVKAAWGPLAPERVAVDLMLEGKDKDELAAYIREHAGELANRYHAMALRYLRQPRQTKQLRPYIRFIDD